MPLWSHLICSYWSSLSFLQLLLLSCNISRVRTANNALCVSITIQLFHISGCNRFLTSSLFSGSLMYDQQHSKSLIRILVNFMILVVFTGLSSRSSSLIAHSTSRAQYSACVSICSSIYFLHLESLLNCFYAVPTAFCTFANETFWGRPSYVRMSVTTFLTCGRYFSSSSSYLASLIPDFLAIRG